MNKQTIITIIVIFVVVGGLVAYAAHDANKPGKYDEFAQCLGEDNITYYGAFWCPNCHEQSSLFGKSEEYLPYVECSTPDGQSQNEVCQEAGIESYPTWEFADGDRMSGVLSLEEIAQQTTCSLPEDA